MKLTVPGGGELHQCQYVKLPTTTEINAVTFAHQYSPGSHHFLVYRTSLTEIPADMTGQYDCTNGDEPVMKPTTGIIYAAQSASGTFPLPAGVGLKMPAGEILMLQAHYINAKKTPIEASVQMGLDTAPASSITQEAGFLIYYDPIHHRARPTASPPRGSPARSRRTST